MSHKLALGSVSYSNICGMGGISAKASAAAAAATPATVCCKKSFNELKGNELNEFQICAKIRSSKNCSLFKSEPQSRFNSCRPV